jgi:hypothetical protein
MTFIKEKVEAKALHRWGNPLIEADPTNCQLTETRSFRTGQLSWRKTFSFRDVEKMTVSPDRDEDGNVTSNFVLHVSMTTNRSVHARYTEEEKKKLGLQDRDYGSMNWFFVDEDVANRVAKAMLHAVELCGGGAKPEPF